MDSPQRCHISNQSFMAKLCSCCLFFNNNAKPQPAHTSPRHHEKKPKTSTKEPLIQEKNPILNLKPQLKPSERESKGLGVVLFKKTMCNCEFLKELNKNNDLYYIENKSHYDKLLNNKKMNPEKKKRLSDNFRVLNILNKFPKNRVFLMKYNSSAILCKITYQNFKFPFIRKKVKAGTRSLMVKKPSTNTNEPNLNVINQLLQTDDKFDNPIEQIDEKLNIFSKFHQGIKINSDSFDKILPEKVCEYLAKKIKKNSFVLDGFCGVGAASIQFALEGHFVLAFEMNEQKFKFAVNNSIVYNTKPKIDFIRGNMLSYRGRQRIDLVFLLMEYENMKPCNDNFCLFSDILPDIRKTLEKALEISPNVVIVLPKFIDVSELALLCTDIHHHRPEFFIIFNKNQEFLKFLRKNSLFKSFSLEIECLAFNSKIEKYAVYFGDLKTITPQEEMDCLIHTLNCESQADNIKAPETNIFIQHIIEKIGIFETCQSYLEIENCSLETPHKTDTNFQLFLEKVLKEGLLSKDDISEYINTTKMKDYMKKARQAGDSKDGSYTFNPFKFQSLEKCTMSAKSYGKDFANNSPYNSIDLRDDNLTKKQMDRISMGENFLEKENNFFSLGQDYIMKKKPTNSNAPSNTENNNTSSIYSDINFDISSDNSKGREFEETEVVEKMSLAKKTVF